MKTAIDHRPFVPLLVISLCLLFLGVNGFIGGYFLLRDPNGAPLGMPVSDLVRTPFQNYLITGFLLLLIWGCGSAATLFGLWLRPQSAVLNLLTGWSREHWGWTLSVALGTALVVWLTVQILTLPAIAPIQYILYGLAALLVGLPLLPSMRKHYHLLMPDNQGVSALFWIKLIHTLAFLVIGAAILYILYSGLFNVGGTGLGIAFLIVLTEIIVFTVNGFRCPLIQLARRLGDATGDDFIADIFLPAGFARLVPLVCGGLAFIGFALVVVRLLMA